MNHRCDYATGLAARDGEGPIECGRKATLTGTSERFGRRYLCAKHREAVAVADALDSMDGLEGMDLESIIRDGREQ